ncbi:hypothetical protein N0V90_012596 [Kalmusia sp. IMI 367209]|nr:hypothetical protein N0V90_012596 [Kalmusia sp. IMI 367209]
MFRSHFLAVALQFSGVFAIVGHTDFPSPTSTPSLERRQDQTNVPAFTLVPDNLEIPTFTFDPIERYIVTTGANADPEPTADKLQIYPTGVFSDFPQDGVTVAFGPDLRKRIQDTAGANCQAEGSVCRDRLLPVIQNTDLNSHAKRFILVTSFLVGEIISFITSEVMVAAAVGGAAVVAVKYDYNDMDQMQSIGEANTNTIAIQHGPDALPTTVTIPTPPIPATRTDDGLITIETMAVDSGEHKAGDVVFHIPEDNRARMQELLHMMGLESVSKACEGQNLLSVNGPSSRIRKRQEWNTCVQTVEDFIPDFVTSAPTNLLQIAPKSFPPPPVIGQDVGFPMQNLKLDGTPVVIPTYRMLRANIPKTGVAKPPQPGPPGANVHLPSLFLSAFAITLVTHAIAAGGQVALDLWVSSADLAHVKTEEFQCPEDILCIEDACKAQREDTVIKQRDAVCVEKTNAGCPCTPVYFPDHTDVQQGYMDAQYDWLQELIQLSNAPEETQFDVKCEGDVQKDKALATGFKDKIKEMCTNHKKLQDGLSINGPGGDKYWNEVTNGNGITWSLIWNQQAGKKDTCDFDCETIFNAFANSSDCVKDDGLLKTGRIETDCGQAGIMKFLTPILLASVAAALPIDTITSDCGPTISTVVKTLNNATDTARTLHVEHTLSSFSPQAARGEPCTVSTTIRVPKGYKGPFRLSFHLELRTLEKQLGDSGLLAGRREKFLPTR